MHIAFITPEYVLPGRLDGGLANYIYKVAHSLTLQGHHTIVFVLSHRDSTWLDGKVKIVEVKHVQLPRLQFPAKIGRLYNSIKLYFDLTLSADRLAKFVWIQHGKEAIDILQTSSFLATGFGLRNNGQIPLVCRISSYSPAWRSAYGIHRSLSETFKDWVEIRQVLDADAAFAPSQFCISIFERFEAFKPSLLRSPCEINKIEPDDTVYENEFRGIRYLLYFGTLSRIKGVDVIAEAIPVIIKSYPEIHFVFVGRDDGMPDGTRMTDLIFNKNKDYQTNIHYLPAMPKAQLYSLIEHSVAVLMPSRVDNYPNACLEAQMLGIPVIGSHDSSLDEMIEDGKTGYLFKNGNVESLTHAIMQIMGLSEDTYQNMKNSNLELIQKINQEDRITELLDFYQHVIDEFIARKRH